MVVHLKAMCVLLLAGPTAHGHTSTCWPGLRPMAILVHIPVIIGHANGHSSHGTMAVGQLNGHKAYGPILLIWAQGHAIAVAQGQRPIAWVWLEWEKE